MDYYRQTTKLLRMHVTRAVYDEMSKDMSDAEKTLLGNVLGLRTRQAQSDVTPLIVNGFDRSQDQLFVFNELFGPQTEKDGETSKLLEAAAEFLEDSGWSDYEVRDLNLTYRSDVFELPLVTGFSLRGTGMYKDRIVDFALGA